MGDQDTNRKAESVDQVLEESAKEMCAKHWARGHFMLYAENEFDCILPMS